MFKRSLAVIAALFSSADACIHSEFSHFIEGREPLHHDAVVNMFEFFEKNEGLESPNADKDRDVRMTNFMASLERVIQHNQQADKTYTKGLNKYSDLSE